MSPFSSPVDAAARTHIGAVRTVNEDRLFNCSARGLWAVSDGMGGHSRGDLAAEAVVGALARLAASDAIIAPSSIAAALGEANARLFAANRNSGASSGATVAGLHIDGGSAHLFWAGDSRIYRYRANTLDLLTRDDRLVQDMIDAGVIEAHEARRHPRATVITKAVGAEAGLLLSEREIPVAAGDLLLLCSDGLTDLVDSSLIAQALSCGHRRAADLLIDAALDAGGSDNISVVVVVVRSIVSRAALASAPERTALF